MKHSFEIKGSNKWVLFAWFVVIPFLILASAIGMGLAHGQTSGAATFLGGMMSYVIIYGMAMSARSR